MKQRQLLPALCDANTWISRDEALHCDFASLIFRKLRRRPERAIIAKMMNEAVELEMDFVQNAVPVNLIGMNPDKMGTYVKFCADRLMKDLGFEPIYNVTNPFEWMVSICLEGKANFFERPVTEYAKASVGVDDDGDLFSVDVDF